MNLTALVRATRILLRHWRFALLGVVVLAVGTGASNAMFMIVDALLLRPLPVHQPGQLRYVQAQTADREHPVASFGPEDYDAVSASAHSVMGVAAAAFTAVNLRAGGVPQSSWGMVVSDNYFRLLGLKPAIGRFFRGPDTGTGGVAEVVLGYRFWQGQFGGDPGVVGRTVSVDGRPTMIVGVAPRGFSGLRVGMEPELWLALSGVREALRAGGVARRPPLDLALVVRLAPGSTAGRAEAELGAVLSRRSAAHPQQPVWTGAELLPVGSSGASRSMLIVLLLAPALLVLLISGVNLAGVLVARAVERRRELAIRFAVGGRRSQVVFELMMEGVLLSLAGAAVGLGGAVALARMILAVPLPGGITISADLSPDWRVLAFVIGSAVVTGVVFGGFPALQVTRTPLQRLLKEDVGTGGGGTRLRSGLVVLQIALSFVLITAAGVLVRTLVNARSIDVGFHAAGVWVASSDLFGAASDSAHEAATYRRILAMARSRPGVDAVALGSTLPLTEGSPVTRIYAGRDSLLAEQAVVAGAYFDVLGIRPAIGRLLAPSDVAGGQPAAVVVNATLARRIAGDGGAALGQTLKVDGQTLEIVGVVPDARYHGLGESPLPYVYVPYAGQKHAGLVLIARAHPGVAVAAALRGVLRTVAPEAAVAIKPLSDVNAAVLLPQRLAAAVTASLGALGVFLAVIGLYTILAHAVQQRAREFSLRMALGAPPSQVVRLFLRRAARLAGVGIALGLPLAFVGTGLLRHLLFGVGAIDPATYALTAAGLLLVCALAAYLPARRAAAEEPMRALRPE